MMRQTGKPTWSVGVCLAIAFGSNCGCADAPPKGWQGHNVEPIGYVKLDGPRAFKLSIARRGERWYLFVGQGHGREGDGKPGFDVVDVSEPTTPRVVTSVHLPAATGQISLHGNLLVVGEQMPFTQAAPGSSIEYPFKGTPVEERTLATFWDVTVHAVRCASLNGGRAATGRTVTSIPVARTPSCRRGLKVIAARASSRFSM